MPSTPLLGPVLSLNAGKEISRPVPSQSPSEMQESLCIGGHVVIISFVIYVRDLFFVIYRGPSINL